MVHRFAFGLIGENLDFKKNIELSIADNGLISEIAFEEPNYCEDIYRGETPSIVIPGLINSHTHIGDSFAKEEGFGKGLIEVVAPPKGLKHRLLAKTLDDIKIMGIKNAAIEMLSNGITYFADFRENELEGIKLLKTSLQDIPIKYKILGRYAKSKDIETILQNADGIGMSSYKKISNDAITQIRSLKRKYNKLVACHHAEFRRKESLFKQILDDKIVDFLVHGTQFSEDDLIELKNSKIPLVLCPRCNGYFGLGFPPIVEILKHRIDISLGTDNVMINSADLFEEMRYLFLIFQVLNKKNPELALSPRDLLKMVTINAAKTLKIENKVGSLERGKFADFFTINLKDENLFAHKVNLNNIHAIITQRVKSNNINKVYLNGERVIEGK